MTMKVAISAAAVAIVCAGCAGNRGAAGSPGGVEMKRIEGTTVAIPREAGGIFAEITRHQAELKAAIQSNQLSQASDHAAAIRELASRIPQRATYESKSEVGTTVQKISKATKEIQEASAAGGKAEVEAQLARLDELIQKMQADFRPL